jgi:hypothetical protein
MASDALGSDQAENDQVDDEMLGVTNNEDQFSGISIGSAWKKQSDKIKNAGHQDASEGETEENSKGPDVGEEAAATTEAGVDSDATQSSQPLIPAKKPLLITGRAWFRKLRQRCAKSFLKYKRQGRRSG